MNSKEQKIEAFGRLLDVLDRLRVECPWDAKQTNESLRPNTIEEVYELSEALASSSNDDIKKELGDVLLHIVFYSKIAEEKQLFDVGDVCNTLCDKLIYRHPHVFANKEDITSEKVSENWEKLKLKEKGGNTSVLSGVPKSLPSLIKAYRIQDKVRSVGFDWKDKEDVWAKVAEELEELKYELRQNDQIKAEEEFGDFVFSIINAARLFKINPDNALEKTNQKFINRFSYIESKAKEQNKSIDSLSLEEMDHLWNEAKAKGL